MFHMVTIFFFGLGQSGTFIANRIQLNLNASQVDTGNGLANALIYINLTTGALSDFLKHVNQICSSVPIVVSHPATVLEGGTSGQKMASNISLGFVLYQNDRFFRTPSYNKQRSSGMVLAGNVSDGVAPHHVELHFNPTVRQYS